MTSTIINYQNKKYFYKALIVLFICSLFLFYKYIAQLFPAVIAENLLTSYQLTGLQISLIASSYYYSYSIFQLIAGYTIDRYSVKIPSFIAIFLVSIGITFFSYTDNLYVMCINRILMGIGASFATVLYMKSAAIWSSPKAFGFISSLLATFTMFGAAFGSAPIAWFFNYVNWHVGLNLIGYIGLILAFFALIFISDKGSKADIQNFKLNASDIKKILTSRINWLLLIYAGLTFSPVLIIGGIWGNPFLIQKLNITNSQASIAFSIMFIAIGIGAPFWAIISAKLNMQKPIMHVANMIAIVTLCSILFTNTSYYLTIILFFIFGFAIGAFMICFQICREYNSVYIMGIAVAFVNVGDGIVSAILEPLIGYVLDIIKTDGQFTLANYQVALSILPVCFILSSLSLKLIKEK